MNALTVYTRNGKAEILTKQADGNITKSFYLEGVLVCYYTGTTEGGFMMHYNNPIVQSCWYELQEAADGSLKTTFEHYTGMLWGAALKAVQTQTNVKVALTALDGSALQDKRFNVFTRRYSESGQPIADVTIQLEVQVGGGWRTQDDVKLIMTGILDNGSESYAGDVATITTDMITMLHKVLVGHAPVGRFLQLQAPE